MIDHENIYGLIKKGYECEFLDFKKVQYHKEIFHELIIDIMSMANSSHRGDKYIILGVKDKPNGNREIFGISKDEFIDSSIYQNVILDNIEPEIKFDYFPIDYENRLLGIIKIHTSNTDKPYMLKKRYKHLNEGLCKVRKGSNNTYATRKDCDNFYSAKEQFEIKFMENSLMAVYDEQGCARTSVTIRNLTKKPVVINFGQLSVISKDGQLISKHRVYGFDNKIIGADFQLTLSPLEEKLGDLFVGFSSTDCLGLGVDEYGSADEIFTFVLTLIDTYNNEYSCRIDDGCVYVKGKFLWKAELKAKNEHKKSKSWSLQSI